MPKVAQRKEADSEPQVTPVKETWPLTQVVRAIETRFPERSGKLVCRMLWEHNGVARYRANWLSGDIGDVKFLYSSFLGIHRERDGFVVEEWSK